MNKKKKFNYSPPRLGGVSAGRGGQIIHNAPHLKLHRQTLRNNATSAESELWSILKHSKFENRKFRRQHSVGNYILDFYCPTEKLAIELDGEIHNKPDIMANDENRTQYLAEKNIKVLRFENKRVFEDIENVLEEIRQSFGWFK